MKCYVYVILEHINHWFSNLSLSHNHLEGLAWPNPVSYSVHLEWSLSICISNIPRSADTVGLGPHSETDLQVLQICFFIRYIYETSKNCLRIRKIVKSDYLKKEVYNIKFIIAA